MENYCKPQTERIRVVSESCFCAESHQEDDDRHRPPHHHDPWDFPHDHFDFNGDLEL